jgi:hypothetical protein
VTGAVGGQVLTNATVGAGVIMLATNGILARGYSGDAGASRASPLFLPRRGHAAVTVRGRGPSASARRAPLLRITEIPHCRSPKFPRQRDGVEGLI